MEELPYEIIEIIGWYSWHTYSDIKSVIRFSMVSKTINMAVHCAQIAPILRHMAMFRPVVDDINIIIHFITTPINQTNGYKKIISGMIHNNAVIYHTNYHIIDGSTDGYLTYHNISKELIGHIGIVDGKFNCLYGMNFGIMTRAKRSLICNFFTYNNNGYIAICNCKTSCCISCNNDNMSLPLL
jgi:hypothetical protein